MTRTSGKTAAAQKMKLDDDTQLSAGQPARRSLQRFDFSDLAGFLLRHDPEWVRSTAARYTEGFGKEQRPFHETHEEDPRARTPVER